jgi:thiamine-phosphate pyrophosphorylase
MTLADLARRLNSRHPQGGPLPSLILLTDPARLPDPLPYLDRLPRGGAVVLREPDPARRAIAARRLLRACRRRGLKVLIAGDPRLAFAIGADGVHWPEAHVKRLAGAARRLHPGWLITAAAHSPAALRLAARAGADAALLSPVFATRSHPEAPMLGAVRFAGWVWAAPLPVYALGGVDAKTARRLMPTNAVGLAAIGGLAEAGPGTGPKMLAKRKGSGASAAPQSVRSELSS